MFDLPQEVKPIRQPDKYQFSQIRISTGCNPIADTRIAIECQAGFEDGIEPITKRPIFTPVTTQHLFDLSLQDIVTILQQSISEGKMSAEDADTELKSILDTLQQINTFANQAILKLRALGGVKLPGE